MGVFKEEAHCLEQVQKLSKQIYSDATDHGYPYKKDDPDSIARAAIAAIKGLKDLVVSRHEWGDKGSPGRGSQVVIEIAWEMDGNIECGTEYTVSYSYDSSIGKMDGYGINRHPDCDSFLSVETKRYRQERAPEPTTPGSWMYYGEKLGWVDENKYAVDDTDKLHPKPQSKGDWQWYPGLSAWINDDVNWVDPAGGIHDYDEEDPAKMYE